MSYFNDRSFIFTNAHGVLYAVRLDATTGVGVATKHGRALQSPQPAGLPVTPLSVDPGCLAAFRGAARAAAVHQPWFDGGRTLGAILADAE